MGRVLVDVKLENLGELYLADRGHLGEDQVRTVFVKDALVDTGATGFSAPRSVIDELGLKPTRTRPTRTAGGPTIVQMFEAVRLTIQGRDCLVDVAEIPQDRPVLIGQIPLEQLDFVVDPFQHQLIGNPAHGGEHMLEMY